VKDLELFLHGTLNGSILWFSSSLHTLSFNRIAESNRFTCVSVVLLGQLACPLAILCGHLASDEVIASFEIGAIKGETDEGNLRLTHR
jgi:hypothetical protein